MAGMSPIPGTAQVNNRFPGDRKDYLSIIARRGGRDHGRCGQADDGDEIPRGTSAETVDRRPHGPADAAAGRARGDPTASASRARPPEVIVLTAFDSDHNVPWRRCGSGQAATC